MLKNRGVIIETRDTDWKAGGETGITFEERLPSGDWEPYLPSDELQSNKYLDTMACVTYSALNCVETQANFLLKTGKFTADQVTQLASWGYIVNNEFNFSDRFTAKMSGTTTSGNSAQKVWDSIREHEGGFGLVPESMWPWDRTVPFDWNLYYAPIPQDIIDFGKNIWKILEFKYEWVAFYACMQPAIEDMKSHLKQSPQQILTKTCTWNDPVITRCGTDCIPNHATMIYLINNYVRDFDHYVPTRKIMSLDMQIPFVLNAVVTIKQPPTNEPFGHAFSQDIRYLQRSAEVEWLQKGLKRLGYFNVNPTGYYWETTRKSVLQFQIDEKLLNWWERYVLCGKLVGPKTRARLNEKLAS